jgi:DNA-directed RNA polymerase subunit RPC12/RpoP
MVRFHPHLRCRHCGGRLVFSHADRYATVFRCVECGNHRSRLA